jgi:DNA-binding LytR/AlgR family response regulator
MNKNIQKNIHHSDDENQAGYLYIKSGSGYEKIHYNDIYFIEGYENYIKVNCTQKIILSLNTMKSTSAKLESHGFVRVHRSFIINLTKIEKILDRAFVINGKTIQIGKSYKKQIQSLVKSLVGRPS